MRTRNEESQRRHARKNSPEWHGMIGRVEGIIAQLNKPELWQIMYQDESQFSEQNIPTPEQDPFAFSYAVLKATDSKVVCGLIEEWERMNKEMEDWQIKNGLVGSKAGKPKNPPRYTPPNWIPSAVEVRVYENQASTSKIESLSDTRYRLENAVKQFTSEMTRNFMEGISKLDDITELVGRMTDKETEFQKMKKEILNFQLWGGDSEFLSQEKEVVNIYFQCAEADFWNLLETRTDFWECQNFSIQKTLTEFLRSQIDSWFGLMIAKNYPSITRKLFQEAIPDALTKTGDKNVNTAFDLAEDLNNLLFPIESGVLHFIHPYQAILTIRSLVINLLAGENRINGSIRLRHPHIQRRVSVTELGGKPKLVTLPRNGLFLGQVDRVVKGNRKDGPGSNRSSSAAMKAENSSDIEIAWARRRFSHDLLVRLGKFELCRLQ